MCVFNNYMYKILIFKVYYNKNKYLLSVKGNFHNFEYKIYFYFRNI